MLEAQGVEAVPAANGQFIYDTFQAIADQYDRINAIISLGLHQVWRRAALQELGAKPGSAVLDVCCGTGDLTALLARQTGPSGRVVGLDFSPAMLRQAKAKCHRRQLSNVVFQPGDALALPFPDCTFHYVTMAFALRNVGNLDRALREMQRVLAPGGRMLVLDLSQPHGALLRPLHACYLQHVLPWVAGRLTGERAAYRWLPESLHGFPDSNTLLSMLSGIGLAEPHARLLLGGIAAIHIAEKASAETGGVKQKGPSPLTRPR